MMFRSPDVLTTNASFQIVLLFHGVQCFFDSISIYMAILTRLTTTHDNIERVNRSVVTNHPEITFQLNISHRL